MYRNHKKTIQDSLGTCELLGFDPILGELLSTATGLKVSLIYNAELNDALEDFRFEETGSGIGERIYNLARSFNIRGGFNKSNDIVPDRFFEETMNLGPNKNKKIDRDEFQKMLNEYYELSGWTEEGIPSKEKLQSLGLVEAIKDLYQKQ
jgi:aldehyde:ferredoxin oxidoreductase